jgi:aminopeptidase
VAARTPDDPCLVGARRIVADLAGIGAQSTVLLVYDASSDPEALAAVRAAIDLIGARRTETHADRFLSGSDQSDREHMPEVTVSLAAPLLTHTDQLRTLLSQGSRYINLRGIDTESLQEAGSVDFHELDAITHSFAEALERSRRVVVSDGAGSHIEFTPSRHALPLSGLARTPGSIGGYPSGEAAVVPVASTVQGIICKPVYVEGFSERDADLTIRISSGQVVDLAGDRAAGYLEASLGSAAPGRTVSEFGLGTNGWTSMRSPRTAKKRLGTAHFGIGDNQTFGGSVVADHHIDVIVEAPTVTADGRELVSNGTAHRSF